MWMFCNHFNTTSLEFFLSSYLIIMVLVNIYIDHSEVMQIQGVWNNSHVVFVCLDSDKCL